MLKYNGFSVVKEDKAKGALLCLAFYSVPALDDRRANEGLVGKLLNSKRARTLLEEGVQKHSESLRKRLGLEGKKAGRVKVGERVKGPPLVDWENGTLTFRAMFKVVV